MVTKIRALFFMLFCFSVYNPISSAQTQKQHSTEIIKFYGYPYKEYEMQTSDGYMLTMHRIPGGKNGKGINPKLPLMVLVHGMLSTSEDFFLLESDSIAFVTADAGYDVWILNMRFTETARHINKSREDNSFWDFGLIEHAAIDIPESIDHALNITGAEKIVYVGLSMGSTIYVMMCNERPDLNKRIAAFVSFGSPFFISNYAPVVRLLVQMRLMETLMKLGLNHMVTKGSDEITEIVCSRNRIEDNPCIRLMFATVGEDYDELDKERAQIILSQRYSAITVKQINHFFQIVSSGVLSKYDYGLEENMKIYNSKTPAHYNWNLCTAPMILYWGKNDRMINQNDMKKVLKLLKGSNAPIYMKISKWKKFNHFDFVIAKNATKPLYKDMLKTLNEIYKKNLEI